MRMLLDRETEFENYQFSKRLYYTCLHKILRIRFSPLMKYLKKKRYVPAV